MVYNSKEEEDGRRGVILFPKNSEGGLRKVVGESKRLFTRLTSITHKDKITFVKLRYKDGIHNFGGRKRPNSLRDFERSKLVIQVNVCRLCVKFGRM